MAEAVRPYRGVSAEERRALRRTRLLEACLDVVGAEGVAGTTAEAICARAGLSKRYFYESFADREAILVAALDDFFAAARDAILVPLAAPGAAAEERLTGTVATLVATVSADPRAARLYVECSRHPALEQRRTVAYDDFADLLLEHAFDASTEAGRPVSRAVALLVVSGTTEVVARWLAGDLDLDEAALVETISGVGIAAAAALAQR